MAQDLAKFLGPMAYFNLNGDNMATYKNDEPCEFIYNITAVEKVVDGDTIDAHIALGFDISVKKRIRFTGINTPESRTRGYKPGRFSFNVEGGRCENCRGEGRRESLRAAGLCVLCDAHR